MSPLWAFVSVLEGESVAVTYWRGEDEVAPGEQASQCVGVFVCVCVWRWKVEPSVPLPVATEQGNMESVQTLQSRVEEVAWWLDGFLNLH